MFLSRKALFLSGVAASLVHRFPGGGGCECRGSSEEPTAARGGGDGRKEEGVPTLVQLYWPSKNGLRSPPWFWTPTPEERAVIQRVALENNIPIKSLVGEKSCDTDAFFDLQEALFALHLCQNFGWKNAMPLLLFKTSGHWELIDWLLSTSFKLHRGELELQAGLTSVTVLGNKGLGKTTCLRLFAELSQQLLPDVVPVYFSFADAKEEHLEDSSFFEKLILAALERNGVDVQKHWGVCSLPGLYTVDTVLKSEGKKVILMLDEFEKLFTEKTKARNEIVKVVAALGGCTSGRVAVLVTGSSSHLFSLVKGTAHESSTALEKYPLAGKQIDMNGEKLRPLRLPPSLPHDVKCVEDMLEAILSQGNVVEVQQVILQELEAMGLKLNDQGDMLVPKESSCGSRPIPVPESLRDVLTPMEETDEVDEERNKENVMCLARALAPIIAFYYGTTPREFIFFANFLSKKKKSQKVLPQSSPPKSSGQIALHHAVLRALKKKNARLLREVQARKHQSHVDLMIFLSTSGWQDRFQGVSVQEIVVEVLDNPDLKGKYVETRSWWSLTSPVVLVSKVEDDLRALYDENVIRGLDSCPEDALVYPVSVYQLIYCTDDAPADPWRWLRDIGNWMLQSVRSVVSMLAGNVVNAVMSLLAGVVVAAIVAKYKWLEVKEDPDEGSETACGQVGVAGGGIARDTMGEACSGSSQVGVAGGSTRDAAEGASRGGRQVGDTGSSATQTASTVVASEVAPVSSVHVRGSLS